MSENPYARGEDEVREAAAPTEQVPVQPEPASWATGSYGSPSTEPTPLTSPSGSSSGSSSGSGTGYEGVAAAYGSPYGDPTATPSGPSPASPYGAPYGDPSGGGIPSPPWGGQPSPQHGVQHGVQHGAWPPAPGQHHAPRTAGFLASLFDTSFDRFVTPVVAKVAYLVVIVAVGLTWVAELVGALLTDATYALVVLVVGGVLALVTVIGARVLIEAVLALVRLAEDTRTIRDRLGDGRGDGRGDGGDDLRGR